MGKLGEEAAFNLEHFKANQIKGGAAWVRSIVAFLQYMGVFSTMKRSAAGDSWEKIITIFIGE
jgi:hypothetical protein